MERTLTEKHNEKSKKAKSHWIKILLILIFILRRLCKQDFAADVKRFKKFHVS